MKLKRTSHKSKKTPVKPGIRRVLDGVTAVQTVETSAGGYLGAGQQAFTAIGKAVSGQRAAILIEGNDAHLANRVLEALSDKKVSLVIHFIAGTTRSGHPAQTGYEALNLFSAAGYLQLVAGTVQEVIDFSLIAHRVAELSLLPVVIVQDARLIAHSLQGVEMLAEKVIRGYLGKAEEEIPSPTPSQKMLFGETRARIPEWLNPDRPAGVGVRYQGDVHTRALAAGGVFFFEHLEEMLSRAKEEFAQLTGRSYPAIEEINTAHADYLICARGAFVAQIAPLLTELKRTRKIKLGVFNIRQSVPFPGGELSHLLKGKKGVTVVEHIVQWDGSDFPLMRIIRDSLDRAVENGLYRKSPLPFPKYAVFQKATDRPRLFSAIVPPENIALSPAELAALSENMFSTGEQRKHVFFGGNLTGKATRVPTLDILQQQIKKFYPHLQKLEPAATQDLPSFPETENDAFYLRFLSFSGGILRDFGRLFVQTLSESGFHKIASVNESELSTVLKPNLFSVFFTRNDAALPTCHHAADAWLVDNPALLTDLSSLKENGLLILHSEFDSEALWSWLPEKIRTQIKKRRIRLYFLNARDIAEETASIPGVENDLAWQALLGAYVAVEDNFSERERRALRTTYRKILKKHFGEAYFLVDEILAAYDTGGKAVAFLPFEQMTEFADVAPELPAPWTVQRVQQPDRTVFDLANFWETAGFFHETGQTDEVPANPSLATAQLPAASSAFRDLTPFRTHIPSVISENCTGCGLCWTHCPDAAIQGTVQEPGALLDAAMQRCRSRGEGMVQLQRILKQLSKTAYNLFAGDDLHQYLTMDALLQEAFNRLIEKMQPDEEQEKAILHDFRHLLEELRGFPIIRTDTFFNHPHQKNKGSGMMLSLAVNPQSCKGCMACVAVCPDDALEAVPQSHNLMDNYRRNWQFTNGLPDIEDSRLQEFIRSDAPETIVYHLLRKKIFYSLIGGDSAQPGSGVKKALRLVTAAAEIVMQPRYQALTDKISQLISRLEDKIQGRVQESFKVNDFAAFAERLAQIQDPDVSPKQLAEILKEEHHPTRIDPKLLRQLSQLVTQLKKLQQLYHSGAHGDGRARMTLLVNAPGVSLWSADYPYNPFPYPALHQRSGDIAALAEGIYDGMMRKMTEVFKTIRIAELHLQENYIPAKHDPIFADFGPDDFSAEELAQCPPLIAILDNAALDNATLRGIERLLTGCRAIKIAVLNTLDDPFASESILPSGKHGREDFAFPEVGLWAVMQHSGYVAQINAGNPGHFLHSAVEGMAYNGPALFHIYASEPYPHGLRSDQGARQENFAIHTRVFPVFVFHPQKSNYLSECFSLEGNPDITEDWATETRSTRDASGIEKPFTVPVTPADWAVREARFKDGFQRVTKSRWHDNMLPLDEFLRLSEQEREGKEPYITLLDGKQQPVRVVVLPQVLRFTEERLRQWQLLQELARVQEYAEQKRIEEVQAEMQQQFEQEKAALEKSYQEQMAQLDQQHRQVYHQRLTRKLLTLYLSGKDSDVLSKTIREYIQSRNGNTKE